MFFRMLPDGLGESVKGPQPEVQEPDRDHCLECAFGKLLTRSGVQVAERDRFAAIVAEGQSVTTTALHTRATIYRCGMLGCDHALMAVTGIERPTLPDDPKDIQIYAVPGSSDCVLPEDVTPT